MDITHQAMSSMAAILAKQKDDVFAAAITHVLGALMTLKAIDF